MPTIFATRPRSRVGGQGGLLELLSGFRAYDDPVRKKSLFFLSLMQNHGLWKFVDPENLGPPVDYHEVRGHLRIGTVRVLDPDLRARLYRGGEVSQVEDVAIRSSVYQAIMLLSRRSGLGPSRLHYLFWNVFRSVCTRDNPDCLRLRPETTLPERYLPLTVHADGPPRCPFSGTCASCGSAELLLEHVFLTDWY